MQQLSESQKTFYKEATEKYHLALPNSPAAEYLAKRGLDAPSIRDEVTRFRLGYVETPLLGHDRYQGWLAIPYLRWSQEHNWIVVNIRFRCLHSDEHDCKALGHGKYESLPGSGTWLYNTNALLLNSSSISVVEGEIDAITSTLCGVPTIGAPGATTWRPYMALPLLGYRRKLVIGDGDKAGREFANKVSSSIPGSLIVDMPEGQDVNSLVTTEGVDAYLRMVNR